MQNNVAKLRTSINHAFDTFEEVKSVMNEAIALTVL